MTLPRDGDTIAAVATATGRGGIGIVRVSGPATRDILVSVCGLVPPPRFARLCDFSIGDEHGCSYILDRGIVLYFPAPDSFTGEDIAEFHAHGGPVVLDLLLSAIIQHGARMATPGEFSQRAFLNGKLDLAQAEAIADLIDSSSAAAARNALRTLQGAFSTHINASLELLIRLRMYVEASIDFPEEEIDIPADPEIHTQLDALLAKLDTVLCSARNGVLLRDGVNLVLAGKPNAGKSSLMNQLAGRDVAIVTSIPGTTRDVLRSEVQIDGLPLHIIDTAGLRHSDDEIEREGIKRALAEISRADRILLVMDSTAGETPEQVLRETIGDLPVPQPPITVLMNKCDLSGREPGISQQQNFVVISLSALSGVGMDYLRSHLKSSVGFHSIDSGDFSARRRHLDALERTVQLLQSGREQLQHNAAAELFAEHLRLAQQALGEITGEFRPDALLGRIFASFCIGK